MFAPHPCTSLAYTFAAGKELNARRSAKQLEAAATSTSAPAPAGGSGRGEKFRAIKAREAAARAAEQVGMLAMGAAVLCGC